MDLSRGLFALARVFSSLPVIVFLAMAAVVWRMWRRREMVVEEIEHDKPIRRSRQTQTKPADANTAVSQAAARTVDSR
jgi:hypothetical protein